MYSYGPPHMAVQKQDDQHEHTFSSYVRIRDVVLKTYLGRWTIGRSGERGSGISVLVARHDDDYKGGSFPYFNSIFNDNPFHKIISKSNYFNFHFYIRFCLVLWHINHFTLFNAKTIFIHINSSILYDSV